MADWQRKKLEELLAEADAEWAMRFSFGGTTRPAWYIEAIADYLLAHGVSVVPGKVEEDEN